MNFRKELAKYGYNKGNSIDVETLVNEILPQLLEKKQDTLELKQFLLTEFWSFCEKEFRADFENDYIGGYGCKNGMSDRTDVFAEHLSKELIKLFKK
jgi:hypothetical protein